MEKNNLFVMLNKQFPMWWWYWYYSSYFR